MVYLGSLSSFEVAQNAALLFSRSQTTKVVFRRRLTECKSGMSSKSREALLRYPPLPERELSLFSDGPVVGRRQLTEPKRYPTQCRTQRGRPQWRRSSCANVIGRDRSS